MPNNKSSNNGIQIHEVQPRENVGRETIARYQAQFRAAANECLSLLEDGPLDRVYCDFHDDFVTRINSNGNFIYNFYQVKTKGKRNHQWSVNEIFGLHKGKRPASPESILNSYVGKLLIHTIKFNNACGQVVFLTNVHFSDDVESCAQAANCGDDSNKYYKLLVENFNDAFSPESPLDRVEIKRLIGKLILTPGITHLSPENENFSAIARDSIYKYSEVDLQHGECDEIINNLISLVQRKSFKKLVSDINESDLDEVAGIGLLDMLDILCISKGAYKLLKDGGDPLAIKNASIIHRVMSKAGARDQMIEFVSQCKVSWDFWLREKRHTIAEFELNFLLGKIDRLAQEWVKKEDAFAYLESSIELLLKEVLKKGISSTLQKELLLGAVFSSMVRGESQ